MNDSDKFVSKMMWAISGPIIVPPMSVAGFDLNFFPGMREQITIQRLVIAATGEEVGSDAEALLYMSEASLAAPPDHHAANIMMFLTRKYMLAKEKKEEELPDFLREPVILDEHMEERILHDFKCWLYRKSMQEIKCRMKIEDVEETKKLAEEEQKIQAKLTMF